MVQILPLVGPSHFIFGCHISEIVFAERPIELKRYRIKQKYNPFSGKSEKEIVILLNSIFVSKYSKVLYSNYGLIFDELESDYAEKNKDFYALNKNAQDKAIKDKVNKIKSTEESENEPPELPIDKE